MYNTNTKTLNLASLLLEIWNRSTNTTGPVVFLALLKITIVDA